jgi:hypothetical protein
VNADGTFEIRGVFGRSRLRVTLPDERAIKAVMHDGRDIADVPIELKSGEVLSGVQVVLTNRITTVAEQIVDDKADVRPFYLRTDSDRSGDGSRFVRSALSDQQGQWPIKGVAARRISCGCPRIRGRVVVERVGVPGFGTSLRAEAHVGPKRILCLWLRR